MNELERKVEMDEIERAYNAGEISSDEYVNRSIHAASDEQIMNLMRAMHDRSSEPEAVEDSEFGYEEPKTR